MSATSSPTPLLCLYIGKQCDQPRAVKASGQLHQLCQYHRLRANASQKRLRFRKSRLQRSRPQRKETQRIFRDETAFDLTEEDLTVLLNLLEPEDISSGASNVTEWVNETELRKSIDQIPVDYYFYETSV